MYCTNDRWDGYLYENKTYSLENEKCNEIMHGVTGSAELMLDEYNIKMMKVMVKESN